MDTTSDHRVCLSIIVPAYNNCHDLARCLSALHAEVSSDSQLIVVDDASTDATPRVAAAGGAQVLRLEKNSGPGAARNLGAAQAAGEVLLFVDADVVVAAGTLDRVIQAFAADPALTALFGSYDDDPEASSLVSRYRNLLHHFVHQAGETEAATFWAGLGAIRRAVFLAVGGFDAARFPRPSIEDIELGYRLRRAGHRIRLDQNLQGKHLKRWRFWSMLRTDVMRRALPWSRLVLDTQHAPEDLNLRASQRLCGALVGLALAAVAVAPWWPWLLGVGGIALTAVAVLNRRFYALLWRRGGWKLTGVGFMLHVLYFIYSSASFAYAALERRVWLAPARRASRTGSP
jgi:cellulose synthase/poly-beta-1,6-N-acetylglucosamine synthase-like glycosyltransferase